MDENERRPAKAAATELAPEIRGALARLAEAHDYAREVLEHAGLLPTKIEPVDPGTGPQNGVAGPHWDPATHVLRVGQRVVKQFRVPSPNQEAVLSAFQEEGWPTRIDDPLPPVPDGCPKDRLRDAIRYLNKGHKNHLIRFRGDGTGEGVLWEPTVDQGPPAAANRNN